MGSRSTRITTTIATRIAGSSDDGISSSQGMRDWLSLDILSGPVGLGVLILVAILVVIIVGCWQANGWQIDEDYDDDRDKDCRKLI